MVSIVENALELIGNTPLIALRRIYPRPGNLFAKVEFMQPGGSVKDRAALKIIKLAYQARKLVKGQTVIEMTSGNMGAGLAVVCNVMGNPFIAVMSSGNSPQRAKMLHNLGAEVILVPQVDGNPGQVTGKDIAAAVAKAKELVQTKKAFYVDQFNHPGSILAHEEGTGPEIWNAQGGKIDAFVAAVGSGGTFIGTSRFLKKLNPRIMCIAVEPEGADILAGNPLSKPKHIIQGIGYGIIPSHWDPKLADMFITVSDQEAEQYRKLLAVKEGLYVGFSAAANVCASMKLLKKNVLNSQPNVVTVLCDTGLKY